VFAPAEGVKVPMIDPRDVAATAAAVLTEDGHQGRTYELTGPEAITFHDVAAQVSELRGRPAQFVPVPESDALEGLLQAGLPNWLAGNIVAVFAMLRRDPSPRSPTPSMSSPAASPATCPSSWPTTRPCSARGSTVPRRPPRPASRRARSAARRPAP
jgi:hypothetical protein